MTARLCSSPNSEVNCQTFPTRSSTPGGDAPLGCAVTSDGAGARVPSMPRAGSWCRSPCSCRYPMGIPARRRLAARCHSISVGRRLLLKAQGASATTTIAQAAPRPAGTASRCCRYFNAAANDFLWLVARRLQVARVLGVGHWRLVSLVDVNQCTMRRRRLLKWPLHVRAQPNTVSRCVRWLCRIDSSIAYRSQEAPLGRSRYAHHARGRR